MHERGSFSDDDILIFLSQLIVSFGIRKEFNSSEARKRFSQGDLMGVIRIVKQFMHLPCGLKVALVKSGFRTFLDRNPLVCKETRSYLKSLDHDGCTCVAMIIHPERMPFFGTSAFTGTSYPMYINAADAWKITFETFVSNVAHELAHLVLESTYHPLRHFETAVDLSVMVLGFNEIARYGTFVCEHDLGYLTPRQLDLAYTEINRQRRK